MKTFSYLHDAWSPPAQANISLALLQGRADGFEPATGNLPKRRIEACKHLSNLGDALPKWMLDGTSSLTRLIQGAINAAAHAAGSQPLVKVGDPHWRQSYAGAFHRLTGLEGANSAKMTKAATDYLYQHLYLPDGTPLAQAQALPTDVTIERTGGAKAPSECPVPRLRLPISHSIMNKRAQAALSILSLHPKWWNLAGFEVVVLGGAAQLAPTIPLVRAGATVHAIVRGHSKRRQMLVEACKDAPGTLILPSANICDVVATPRELAAYIAAIAKPVIVVDSLYAPSRKHLHLALAADLVEKLIFQARPHTTLMLSGTPTDVYRFEDSLVDAIVPLQGPNYLAAKRIGRWRASLLHSEGAKTITPILPLAATESVMNSPRLISTVVGAPAVGIYPADPVTASQLAASWLLFEVNSPQSTAPWQGSKAPCGLWGNPDSPLNSLLPNANMRMHAALVAGRLGAGRERWVGQVPESVFAEGAGRLRALVQKAKSRLGRY